MSVEYGRYFAVVGTSGSGTLAPRCGCSAGETTVANQIARRLGLAHVELDALHWEPGWAEAPLNVFRERVAQALDCDGWAVDGNYSKVRDFIWSRADTIVWLDYALPVIMCQLVGRTLQRIVTREELWGSNRESLSKSLFSRESILLWALQTYRRRREEYPDLLSRSEYVHLTVVHLRSPRDTRAWLSNFTMPHASKNSN
jgi:adenylate kinase family enzyme